LDALKARKYMCQFDTKNSITVMCNEVDWEFKGKRNRRLLLNT
jgi:hypothetical protein